MEDRDIISGLENTGNTCFFNSVLQALAAVPQFHEYVRGIVYAASKAAEIRISSKRDKRALDAPGRFDAVKPDANIGAVAARVLAILRALSWPRRSHFPPRHSLVPAVALGEFSSTFEDSGQHDAQVRFPNPFFCVYTIKKTCSKCARLLTYTLLTYKGQLEYKLVPKKYAFVVTRVERCCRNFCCTSSKRWTTTSYSLISRV